ncbi:MAG: response regulator [Candidatus Omnitrophota bacterium]
MSQIRVLIIEDALFMRSLIKDILTKEGFSVCAEASNALEGLEKFKELKPDLVTLDIIMPKMEEVDGITAIREILAFDKNAKIIIVSSLAERRLIQESLFYGAKDFVVKPFTAERLLGVVKKVLDIKT